MHCRFWPSIRRRVSQERARKRWARYDDKVEALLGMGAAGVVETLMRTVARNPHLEKDEGLWAQVRHSRLCSKPTE